MRTWKDGPSSRKGQILPGPEARTRGAVPAPRWRRLGVRHQRRRQPDEPLAPERGEIPSCPPSRSEEDASGDLRGKLRPGQHLPRTLPRPRDREERRGATEEAIQHLRRERRQLVPARSQDLQGDRVRLPRQVRGGQETGDNLRACVPGGGSALLVAWLLVPMLLDHDLVNHSRWEAEWKWNSLGVPRVIMLPDEYLAQNVAATTDVEVIAWHGRCEVHEKFSVEDIQNVRKQFPDVVILAHPECSPEVVAASDYSGSTTAMIRYVEKTRAPRYLLLTECSMGDNIAAAHPEKPMLRLCSVRCPHMNEITLEDTLESLVKEQYEIEIDEEIRVKALRSVERMLEIGRED